MSGPGNESEVGTIKPLVPAGPFLVLAEVTLELVMTTGRTLFQGPLQLPSCTITIPVLQVRKPRPRRVPEPTHSRDGAGS